MNIHNISNDFQFNNINLLEPIRIQGGAYFSVIKNEDVDFYINVPKCSTKNGVVKSGKRTYCDLMFNVNNDEFINWIVNLEKHLKQLLYEKSYIAYVYFL